MFRRLQVSVDEHKLFAESAKTLKSDKLFSMRDAAARCFCGALIHGRFYGALSLLAQYYVLDKEIQRRCSGV